MSLRFPCLPTFFVSAVFSLAKLNGSEQKVKALGGRLFHKKGEVVEVVLNGAGLKPGGLKFLADFRQLTDLSLEKTSADDEDMAVVAKLPNLEWLNLYRTQVGRMPGLSPGMHCPRWHRMGSRSPGSS